ncbi:MAG: hypothetical protein IIB11_02030 [Chloroflexi bacterium]|nr:hypothetical protein [Chloroflexota bacterium]
MSPGRETGAAVSKDPKGLLEDRARAFIEANGLARSPGPLVVGVSCNPNTFARDARTLVDGGYEITSILPIDQFLWSSHVELLAVFQR